MFSNAVKSQLATRYWAFGPVIVRAAVQTPYKNIVGAKY